MTGFEVTVVALLSALIGLGMVAFVALIAVGEHLKDLKAYMFTLIDRNS